MILIKVILQLEVILFRPSFARNERAHPDDHGAAGWDRQSRREAAAKSQRAFQVGRGRLQERKKYRR